VLRALIIDDEENQSRTLSIGLRLEGFDVVISGSSVEALQALEGASPPIDIALIDLMMPGLNGLELARQIRRLYPSVRVVLSSAYHLSARQLERADVGLVGFIPKPYKGAQVSALLRNQMRVRVPPTSSLAGTQLPAQTREVIDFVIKESARIRMFPAAPADLVEKWHTLRLRVTSAEALAGASGRIAAR
jgi:CheY-like chemotaxis protein